MTILVTGCTGLVGSRLLPRLTQAGVECRALVRRGKTAPSGGHVVEGDILDPDSLVAAVTGVTAVVHLAAVLRSSDPEQIWQVNVEGTRHLLKATRTFAPDARFILASTGLVYDEASSRPALESDTVAPTRPYPASKFAAERLLRESGLNGSILRFGFVYGDSDGHIGQIPHIASLLNLHPANRLSMLHHRDLATFVIMALKGVFDGRIVNAVDEAPMTILELSALAGQPMEPSNAPLDNPWSGVIDGSLARRLGFRPEVATTWQAERDHAL